MSTARALQRVREATEVATILDVGCGPGAQTIDLASRCDARLLAIDTHRPYLTQLRQRAARAPVSNRVHALEASMFALPVRPHSIDVVWAEGAIYLIGFGRALREWKQVLAERGCIAATHLAWLRSDAPGEPRSFWARHFPDMVADGDNLDVAREAGYTVLDHFTLPESAWWTDYYEPLERRLAALRPRYAGVRDALAMIETTQEQIDLYRRFSPFFGYVFYVLQRAA